MKNLLTFSLSALMLSFMATSCSSDDEIKTNDNATKAESYISVKISDVGGSTQSRGTDEGYTYGTESERSVTDVKFYFYDSNEHLLTEAELSGADIEGSVNSTESQSIEYIGKAVIPIHDINPANLPQTMVTVINPPVSLEGDVSSLTNIKAALAANCRTAAGTFTMTTSTFKDTNNALCCVTALTKDNFYETEQAANESTSPINVYVERLAAKVQLTIDPTVTPSKWTAGSADNTYKLGDYEIAGIDGTTALYVNFISWGLNATTQKSLLMKNIDTSWTDAALGFTWNDAANYRTYWGKSYNYGDASCIYPDHYIADEHGKVTLNYISANEIASTLGFNYGSTTVTPGIEYCNENTNTSDILVKAYNSTATSALIKARLVKSDGSQLGDLIKYNSKFYTPDAYIAHVHSGLTNSGKLAFKQNGTPIAISDLRVIDGTYLNGRVVVALTEEAAAKTGWTDGNNNDAAVTTDSINEVLAAFNANSDAIGYKDGLMYYSIPIEHLNNTENTIGTSGTKAAVTNIAEGHYGVVRNHYYKITVTSCTKPGHGINIPDEPIVPNPDVEEDYYIGAQINILAWKTVSQQVTLE